MRLECGWRHAQKRWFLEFEDFEKEWVEIEPWTQTVEFLSLRHRVEFSTIAAAVKFFGSRPVQDAPRIGGVSIVRIVSLSLYRHEPTSEINKPCVSETTESARILFVFVFVLYVREARNKFPDFFRICTFIDSTDMKRYSPPKSPPAAMHFLYWSKNFCKAHGSPHVWACQWPSSQPLSSPQLSHNDSLWA